MYYILNETDQVIAADDKLLTLCNVTDVHGLSSKMILGDTTFTSQDEESVTINTSNVEHTFSVSKTSLSSILGHMTLVVLDGVQDDTVKETEEQQNEELFSDTIDEAEELSLESDASESVLSIEDDLSESSIYDLSTEEDTLFLGTDEAVEESPTQAEITLEDVDEPFGLLDDPTESQNVETLAEDEQKDDGEIVVDVAKISQVMGMSDEDYTAFLNEYIDTALELEEDLQSDDMDKRNSAIMTLSDLSEIMHLPEISNIMGNINSSSPAQQKGYIGSLYTTLSRLTTQSSSNESVEMEFLDDSKEPEEIKVEAPTNPNSFGTIDLSNVQPKHFNFQLEEAANDLSLPVELIKEFVHDFIEQARIETKNMLKAYEEGDLEKIQSIGHLLKGASSNLRINALSDTLYKIQFCENEDGLDDMIKDYWAHFLSFETQINVTSN